MDFAFPARTIRIAACASIVRSCCIDPYAKAIAGEINWADEMFGYVVGGDGEDLTRDFRDDAWGMPKAVGDRQRF